LVTTPPLGTAATGDTAWEQGHAGTFRNESRQIRGRGRELLQVVQHDEHLLAGEEIRQHFGDRPIAAFSKATRKLHWTAGDQDR